MSKKDRQVTCLHPDDLIPSPCLPLIMRSTPRQRTKNNTAIKHTKEIPEMEFLIITVKHFNQGVS